MRTEILKGHKVPKLELVFIIVKISHRFIVFSSLPPNEQYSVITEYTLGIEEFTDWMWLKITS